MLNRRSILDSENNLTLRKQIDSCFGSFEPVEEYDLYGSFELVEKCDLVGPFELVEEYDLDGSFEPFEE